MGERSVRLVETPVDVTEIDLRQVPKLRLVENHHRRLSDEYSWKNDAPCKINPDLFFPEKGDNGVAAKRICMECPVREKCLDVALERGESFGIWGGMGSKERRALAKARGLV